VRVRGSDFRAHVCPVAAITRAAEAQGLTRVVDERASFAWHWTAFER
jgi:hypothetical protein